MPRGPLGPALWRIHEAGSAKAATSILLSTPRSFDLHPAKLLLWSLTSIHPQERGRGFGKRSCSPLCRHGRPRKERGNGQGGDMKKRVTTRLHGALLIKDQEHPPIQRRVLPIYSAHNDKIHFFPHFLLPFIYFFCLQDLPGPLTVLHFHYSFQSSCFSTKKISLLFFFGFFSVI